MVRHYTKRPLAERFWEKVKKVPGGCWEWKASVAWHGYGQITTTCNGKPKTNRAHRVAWEMTHGPIPDGLCVLHKCDNPKCMNPEHLFLGTLADNTHDAMKKGRLIAPPETSMPGETHPLSKLTDDEIRQIRILYDSGDYFQREIADMFGVVRETIGKIVRREAWTHVC